MEEEKIVKKSNKKGLIITLSIIGLLLIILIAGFVYINKTFNASSFLNRVEKEINKEIEEAFNVNSFTNNMNIEDNDLISNIDLSFTTNEDALKELNELNFNIKNEIDAKKEYNNTFVELLKKDESIIKGDIIVNSDGIFISSKDIFDKVLKLEATIENEDELKDLMAFYNVDNLKYFLTKSVEYYVDSLKEAKMTTKKSGLSVTYEFEINDETKSKIINKYNDLVNKDSKYKEMVTKLNITSNDIEKALENATISIKENMINKEIEEFNINSNGSVLTGKRENDNTFTIKDEDNNSLVIKSEKDKKTLTLNEENQEPINIIITEKKDTTTFEVTEKDNKATIEIYEMEDNKYKVSVTLSSPTLTLDGNIDIKIDKNKAEYTGKINANADDKKFGVSFIIKQEVGKDLITKKDTKGSVDANKLSQSEQTVLMTNLLTKLSKLDTFNKLLGLF